MPRPSNGWYDMVCWNGLSPEQQERLIHVGNLPMGYRLRAVAALTPTADGVCKRPAEVCVETMYDAAPGPRFYCRECAVAFLQNGEDFTCPRCGLTSHQTMDRVERYCGACHDWTGLG